MKRPNYEALNKQGAAYFRVARIIGELPKEQVPSALTSATLAIAKKTGLTANVTIRYGESVFMAYAGMDLTKAKMHEHATILLKRGADVSLDFCVQYERERIDWKD
ncbi:hypothetical protein ACMYR3_17045 (plasmid) [Ampullimonas aquatilis]|uniref:hypothetical protein n=1 Tax=Ampullimonas aquatilis TaxID=1341549 RepID=UPI003C710CD4